MINFEYYSLAISNAVKMQFYMYQYNRSDIIYIKNKLLMTDCYLAFKIKYYAINIKFKDILERY